MNCCLKKKDNDNKPKSRSKEINKVEAFFNLLQSNEATGLLALPNAVMSAGLITGTVGLLVTGFFSTYCVNLLLMVYRVVAINGERLDYAEVAEQAFRQSANSRIHKKAAWMKHFTNTILVINQIGACIVYHTFCPHMVKKVLDSNLGYTAMPLIVHQVIITSVLVCFTAVVRNYKDMAVVSTFTTITMLGCLIAMLQYVVRHMQPIENLQLTGGGYGFFLFLGSAMFSFEVSSTVLPIENKMAKQHRPAFDRLMWISMTIVVALFTSLGTFGYLCFGADSLVILTNLPTNWVFDTVTILWVICVIVSYNLQLAVPASILADYLATKYAVRESHNAKLDKESIDFRQKFNISDLIARSTIVLFTFCVTALVPCLEEMVGLIGNLCSSCVTTLIPAVCLFVVAAPRRAPAAAACLRDVNTETTNLSSNNLAEEEEEAAADAAALPMQNLEEEEEEEGVEVADVEIVSQQNQSTPRKEDTFSRIICTRSRRMWFLGNAIFLTIFGLSSFSVGTYVVCEKIYERMTSEEGCSA